MRYKRNQARKGDHNLICDRSGAKVHRSECKKTWDGYIVLKHLWEPRQPQDFVRGVQERIAVPDPRPEATDTFVAGVTEVSASDL